MVNNAGTIVIDTILLSFLGLEACFQWNTEICESRMRWEFLESLIGGVNVTRPDEFNWKIFVQFWVEIWVSRLRYEFQEINSTGSPRDISEMSWGRPLKIVQYRSGIW